MDDYISREAALRAICDKQRDHTHWKSNYELGKYQGANGYTDAIKAVPAADVRPVVRAEWKNEIRLNDENGSLEWHGLCSRCLMTFSTFGVYAKRINFCPNCGADMRGAGK